MSVWRQFKTSNNTDIIEAFIDSLLHMSPTYFAEKILISRMKTESYVGKQVSDLIYKTALKRQSKDEPHCVGLKKCVLRRQQKLASV